MGPQSLRVTDHSKKMAAIVSLNNHVAAHGVAALCPAASIRQELTVIILAVEDSSGDEELTCRPTRSLGELDDAASEHAAKRLPLLQSLHRRDFPLWLDRHTARQLLVCAANLINRLRAWARGVMTCFIKV